MAIKMHGDYNENNYFSHPGFKKGTAGTRTAPENAGNKEKAKKGSGDDTGVNRSSEAGGKRVSDSGA